MIGTGTLAVRQMRAHDIEAVCRIDTIAYSRPWSAATWRRELADPQRHHLVAMVGGDLIGHAGVMFVPGEAHVTTVAVDEGHQGQGIATLLVLDLLDEVRARGVDAATLEVRAADRRAQRIYSRVGFSPAGIRRRYYSDPVDDAVVMWLSELDSERVRERHEPIRTSVLEPEVERG